jgi:hypothetical protein
MSYLYYSLNFNDFLKNPVLTIFVIVIAIGSIIDVIIIVIVIGFDILFITFVPSLTAFIDDLILNVPNFYSPQPILLNGLLLNLQVLL